MLIKSITSIDRVQWKYDNQLLHSQIGMVSVMMDESLVPAAFVAVTSKSNGVQLVFCSLKLSIVISNVRLFWGKPG